MYQLFGDAWPGMSLVSVIEFDRLEHAIHCGECDTSYIVNEMFLKTVEVHPLDSGLQWLIPLQG